MSRIDVLLPLFATLLTSATPTAALLPVRVEQAAVDEAPMYARLDAALRRAGGGSLQDGDATAATVAAARDVGVHCVSDERACLAKLAALAEAERVLAPWAVRAKKTVHMRIHVVDSAGRIADVEGDIALEPEEAMRAGARDVVSRALKASLAAPVKAVSAESFVPASSTSEQATKWPIAGLVLAGTGSALFAGGAMTATALDVVLQKPEAFADRAPKLFAGQVGLLVASAGALTAAGGALLIAMSPGP